MVTSPNFFSIYSNDTQIQVTPWDIRLTFGEIAEMPTREKLSFSIRLLGEVRLSSAHAKKLAELLMTQVAQYEGTIGPISMPPEMPK